MGDPPSEEEAQKAAEEVIDADTLLPGEPSAIESRFVEDAESWREVYQELFLFKQQLLSTLLEQRDKVQGRGRHEVQNGGIVLTRQADRLARRLEFWQREALARKEKPGAG